MICVIIIFIRINIQIANQNVRIAAQRRLTRSHACFSARNVVQSAFVFLRGPMATRKCALATIIGRPRKENQNALD